MRNLFTLISLFVVVNGLAQSIESQIDSIFQQFNSPEAPGAGVMVIKKGGIVFKKGYGLERVSSNILVDENTCFLVGEVAKQFTGMCIMLLKEQGKLSYQDNLNKFFKGFPEYGKQVSIENLMHHTSGLINYKNILPENEIGEISSLEILKLLKQQDSTMFEPGTKRNFNNYDYTILALIVERASGMSYAKYINKYIFKPLQMDNAAVFGNKNQKIKNRALGAVLVEDDVKDVNDSLRNVLIGENGIYLSLNDYYKWDQALYSDKLVSKETLKKAFLPGNYKNRRVALPYYGFGWYMRTNGSQKYLFHGGSTLGFTNFVFRYPEEQLTVVVFVNFDSIFGIRKGVYKVVRLFSDINFLY